jgi:hypothetical protein
MTRPAARVGLLRKLARWHRMLGLTSAAFVLWLAASGLILNHGEALGLDQRHVHNAWLLKHYGIPYALPKASFSLPGHWLSQEGNAIYFDANRELVVAGTLVGAVNYGQMLVAATNERLYLFDASGNLLDNLGPEHGLPAAIQALGVSGNWLVLRHLKGLVRLNPDTLQMDGHPARDVIWAKAGELPPALRAEVEEAERSQQISFDRVLRDLHSGRILGPLGSRLVDAAAVLFMVLAVSGMWIWWRAKKEFGRNQTRKLKVLTEQ